MSARVAPVGDACVAAWVAATVNITGPFEADPLLPPELATPSGRATREAYWELTQRFLADVDGADQYSVALEMLRLAEDQI
jgi:hypothetical protein